MLPVQVPLPPANPKPRRYEWLLVGILLAATILSFLAVQTSAFTDPYLRVYFLDVDQGDAQFIQAPNGNQVLIDGGPDGSILSELGKVMPFNDRSIDLLILTHPHADHVVGLNEVLARYEVKTIIENAIPYTTAEYARWQELKQEAQVIQAQAGQVVDLGGGVSLAILHPSQPGTNRTRVTAPHEFMVVSKLNYGQQAVLFTGDMEAKLETTLLNEGGDLTARFLKIGHHGSKTSSSESFLTAVGAEVGFIGVGEDNKYGLPNQSILDRLAAFKLRYYRTDVAGTIELKLDGENYLIKTEHE